MSAPTSQAEYESRFETSSRIEGYGYDVRTVVACYFCGAPGFQTWRIWNTDEDMQTEATCAECGRSGKAVIDRTPGSVVARFVQTGGPDPDPWVPIKRAV